MVDWSDGYVKGIDYTYEYYRELNPLSARIAMLNAGYAVPVSSSGACCELGFGFGVSTNIHAAASGNEWWGTDFNATQAGFARELAQASGANTHFFDEAFADFCHRPDLPEFDFIGLHGIWSWVSDESRRMMVDFVRRRLRVGGIVYVSYNTQPGWAQMVPVRQLMMEHAETMSAPGIDISTKIDSAIDYVESLMSASLGYADLNPLAASRIKHLKGQTKNYLAHEYFNRDWQPMLHSEFCRWFQPAKVAFACSALYSDHFDVFNLLPPQVDILNRIADPMFRQSARDFVVNRQFRKDYWVKGPRRLEASEQRSALRALRVMLVAEPAKVALRAGGSLTESDLAPATYLPLVEALADHQIYSIGQLEEKLKSHSLPFNQLIEAVMVLIGKGDVASVQDDAAIERGIAGATRLNHHLIESSLHSSRVCTLASPVTGGGFYVQPFHLQMLLARQRGLDTAAQWAGFILKNLAEQGAGITRPDGGVMAEEDGLAAITSEARSFEAKQLQVLKALKIVS